MFLTVQLASCKWAVKRQKFCRILGTSAAIDLCVVLRFPGGPMASAFI